MTFIKMDYKTRYQYTRHKVKAVGLSTGDQGIPDGFMLTARCGERERESEIDFEPSERGYDRDSIVICDECFPTAASVG